MGFAFIGWVVLALLFGNGARPENARWGRDWRGGTGVRGAGEPARALTQIFDLADSPGGVVIAAIFELTPSLLIERLKAQTEALKGDLASTGHAGGTQQDAPGLGTSG